jgi:hypothetical protein
MLASAAIHSRGTKLKRKSMNRRFEQAGKILGVLGTIACLVAIVLRLLGNYMVGGIGLGAVIQGGTASVAVACFVMLLARSE